jgi:hypothetical protein
VREVECSDLLDGQCSTGFAQQGGDEQATAHADASMNLPYRKVDSGPAESLLPRENVLVNAVDERSVKVEQHARRLRRGLDHRLGHDLDPYCMTPHPTRADTTPRVATARFFRGTADV